MRLKVMLMRGAEGTRAELFQEGEEQL